MTRCVEVLAFDADDTLWQNEEFFRITQDRFYDLLRPYADDPDLEHHLLDAERRNIQRYGYGIKGFMLSMIETALDVTDNRAPASVIREIMTLGRDMLDHPIHLLKGVAETLPLLAERYPLILITKGDLLHQEQKIARSGLGDLFSEVHIVSEKDEATYHRVLGQRAPHTTMVGNSMKSDILPVLALGGYAIHIPARYEWALERADTPTEHPRFFHAVDISAVGPILTQIG